MNNCHEIVKGTLASQCEVYFNTNNTWLKVSNCHESPCKHLANGQIKKKKRKRKVEKKYQNPFYCLNTKILALISLQKCIKKTEQYVATFFSRENRYFREHL